MSQELQLGKYKFFPYDEKIQRLLDKLLPVDEKSEKYSKEYLDKLLEQIKPAHNRRTRQGKNK